MRKYGLSILHNPLVLYKPVVIIAIALLGFILLPESGEDFFFTSFSTGVYQVLSSLLLGNVLLHFAHRHFILKWVGILYAPKPNRSLGLLLSTLIAFTWLLNNLKVGEWTSIELAHVMLAFGAGSALAAFLYNLVGFKARDLSINYQIDNDRQEAFIAVIAAAMFLGTNFSFLPSDFIPMEGNGGVLFPLYLAIAGLIITFLAAVVVGEKPKNEKVWLTLSIVSMVLMMIVAVELVIFNMPNHWSLNGIEYQPSDILLAVQLGLIAGLLAGISVKFYNLISARYIQFVLANGQKRVWLNVALRVFINVIYPFLPIILVSIALLISFSVAGIYGASISFLGMLSNVGLSLVIDGNKLNTDELPMSAWQKQKLELSSPKLSAIWKFYISKGLGRRSFLR